MKNNQNIPLIFDIRRGSIDDGPGIRTIVFLKGYQLKCIWCHNPESIDFDVEIAFYSEKCIKSGECKTVCPTGAINLDLSSRIERSKCIKCGKCAEVCPNLALKKIGKFYSADQLIEVLMLDKEFYNVSGGGVTFSGGEPLLHIDYLEKVIKELKKNGIDIAIETCGFFDLSIFKEKIMKYIDTIFYDIKFIDSALHEKYTGRDNSLIIENFKYLIKEKSIKVIPRVPLIPNITATPENLLAIADFLRESGVNDYDLLSYNPGGISKRFSLQKEIPVDLPEYMDKQQEIKCREIFEKRFRRTS